MKTLLKHKETDAFIFPEYGLGKGVTEDCSGPMVSRKCALSADRSCGGSRGLTPRSQPSDGFGHEEGLCQSPPGLDEHLAIL